jgi:hypothetical protein
LALTPAGRNWHGFDDGQHRRCQLSPTIAAVSFCLQRRFTFTQFVVNAADSLRQEPLLRQLAAFAAEDTTSTATDPLLGTEAN